LNTLPRYSSEYSKVFIDQGSVGKSVGFFVNRLHGYPEVRSE